MGVGVLANSVVELLRDATEVRRGVRAERMEQASVVLDERDVPLELVKARLHVDLRSPLRRVSGWG